MAIPITNVLHQPNVLPEWFVSAMFQPEITSDIEQSSETLEASQVGTLNIMSQGAL